MSAQVAEGGDLLARVGVPEPSGRVAEGHDPPPVWAECGDGDVTAQNRVLSGSVGVPQPGRRIAPPGQDMPPVRAERSPQQRAAMPGENRERLAALGIPRSEER